LISVGRLTDQKDQITILKSLITIVKTKKIKLIIAGKGDKEFELKKFTKENDLEHCVNFIGYKDNPYPYIKKSDIFILTSKYEGSPNVLIEAQFLNKYIISTDCPTGPKEILKNYKNSKLIKVGDFKTLANIIKNFTKKKLKNNSYFFSGLYKYQLYFNCNKYLQIINHLQKK
jgi:glycosyltransferase involved in cell wall biosynthesis